MASGGLAPPSPHAHVWLGKGLNFALTPTLQMVPVHGAATAFFPLPRRMRSNRATLTISYMRPQICGFIHSSCYPGSILITLPSWKTIV